jgi:16S rRNA (cytosine967-C5)-methyltransferase
LAFFALAFGVANPDFTPLDVDGLLTDLKLPSNERLCNGPFLRLWPHRHATDGFFAAVWQRN